MPIFTELKQKLSQQLNEFSTETDIVELQANVALKTEYTAKNIPDLLAWLKGQSAFPQFFWQSRNQHFTFATLGIVRQFTDLTQAQSFSQRYNVRLFGGVKFEGQCHFILPRIVLAKTPEKLTAYLYFSPDKPDEKAECLALLKQIETVSTFSPIENTHLKTEKISDFNRWQNNVQCAIQAITQHEFRKVVLANATTLTLAKTLSPYNLLHQSQQKNHGCYHFLWAEKLDSAFIGSSPERLYQRDNNQFQTEALAGTVAVSEDRHQTEQNALWLLSDRKNIQENQFVVDDIQQNLADCVSKIKVNKTEIKRLNNIQHLRRKIQATLYPDITDADCLRRIHPTAAVAGLPRPQALDFITQNEGFSRGWYASAFGTFSPKNAEFCVALRSADIANNQITLYAGAGIVENSTAISEWEEIERKSLALGQILNDQILELSLL